MRVRSLAAWSCLTAAMAFGVAACGDDDSGGGGGGAKAAARRSPSIRRFRFRAIPARSPRTSCVASSWRSRAAGGKAGDFTIKYQSLDDATAATGKWEPGKVSENARKAVGDDNTIAYLGEFNSGASAISIPLLNEAGILQVSPSNTYVGLTRSEGAEKGEPQKYQPSGTKTFGRVVPADHIQAAAQVSYMKDQGVTKLYILNDKEVYGKGIADAGREDRRRAGHRGPRQRRHRHQGGELPLARGEDQELRRRRLLLRRHHAEQGRPGVQGRRRVQPGHQDVRPGRRRRVRLQREARLEDREARLHHQPDAGSEGVPAVGAGLLQGVQGQVRQGSGAVRDLRLRGHERHARGDQERRREGQRPSGSGGRVLQDQGPGVSPRHLRHRRERRHHAVRLRRKPDQGRQARLRQGHQGRRRQ